MKARKIFLISGTLFLPVLLNSAEPNFSIYYCSEQPHSSDKVGYIFVHGLGATQEQASLFLPSISKRWIFNTPTILFDFPDAKNNNMEYYGAHVNLGQENDIQRLEFAFEKALSHFPKYKFVLGGISRGSATIINFVALHQPQSVGALVLESPFDSISNIIKHLLKRFHVSWIPFSKKIAYKIAKKNFPLLNMNGVFPIHVIDKIPVTIPIIIIHSKRDRTIPINSSRNLYKALLLAGHPHVYILELESGEHGRLLEGLEGELYNNVVHAFYKKYNFPHNALWAQSGEIMLNYCQPSLDEINKRIRRKRSDEGDEDLLYEDEEEEFIYTRSLESNRNQKEDSVKNNLLITLPSKLLDLKYKIKF